MNWIFYYGIGFVIILVALWVTAGNFWRKVGDKIVIVTKKSLADSLPQNMQTQLEQSRTIELTLDKRVNNLEQQYESLLERLDSKEPSLDAIQLGLVEKDIQKLHDIIAEMQPQLNEYLEQLNSHREQLNEHQTSLDNLWRLKEALVSSTEIVTSRPEAKVEIAAVSKEGAPEEVMVPLASRPQDHDPEAFSHFQQLMVTLRPLLSTKGIESQQLLQELEVVDFPLDNLKKIDLINKLFLVLGSEDQQKKPFFGHIGSLLHLKIDYPAPGDRPGGDCKMARVKKDQLRNQSYTKKVEDFCRKFSFGLDTGSVLFVVKPSIWDGPTNLQQGVIVVN